MVHATVFGQDVVQARRAARRRLGLVFQEPTVDPFLTVRENLDFAAALAGLDRRQARDAITVALQRMRARIIVVEAHGRVLGLLVDAVNQVVNVPADAVLAPPGEVLSAQTDYVTGIGRLDTRLIILLDLDRALLLAAAAWAITTHVYGSR